MAEEDDDLPKELDEYRRRTLAMSDTERWRHLEELGYSPVLNTLVLDELEALQNAYEMKLSVDVHMHVDSVIHQKKMNFMMLNGLGVFLEKEQ